MMAASGGSAGFRMPPDFNPMTQANSPEVVGLAVAHLAAGTDESDRNGTALTLFDASEIYGFKDYDGQAVLPHASVANAVKMRGSVAPLVFSKMMK